MTMQYHWENIIQYSNQYAKLIMEIKCQNDLFTNFKQMQLVTLVIEKFFKG